MEKKSEIIESFKVAISSTVKSLSNLEDIEISFGNQNHNSKKNLIQLPEPEQTKNKINYNQIRAIADSKSLMAGQNVSCRIQHTTPKLSCSRPP